MKLSKQKSEFDYKPSDIDRESIVLDVPNELLMNSIVTQFDDMYDNRKTDYIQTFISKYEFDKDNLLDDDSDYLEMEHDKFISFMKDMFEERLDIGFPDMDDDGVEQQHELIHITYRFFVKNIKKNMVNVIKNYIEANRSMIESMYAKKKDVTALNFKNEIEDEFDILILSNLTVIISDAIEDIKLHTDIDEFFELCIGDEPSLELEFVKDAYDDVRIVGNFIEKYLDNVTDDFEIDIHQKIRNSILKKYPKRTIKKDLEEITDEN